MNPREMGLRSGGEILKVTYRGEVEHIPVASTFIELKGALARVVVPEFEKLVSSKKPGELVDIGFVDYVYKTDQLDVSDPEAAAGLIQALRNAGFTIPDKLKKLDPIAPERYKMISEMRRRPDYYQSMDHFANGTFIIGPISVDPIEREPYIYDYVLEVEAARLRTEASVAVHGSTLIADIALDENRDRIFNEEIVRILDRAFHPYLFA